ncbi:glycosyltransferase family 34 protein [Plenodomus tracheiphilus IPT5]|uniref:Glycosyltransferase family 34 protein n=1 Tax=Plenodomus tracheiphilus IPT5 TaxID=1408161 RepID=A0A6A7AQ23_9PLEO|nr:glycosyltransferase family 34 protein [Plenodomus tracheiphilus IPT5]
MLAQSASFRTSPTMQILQSMPRKSIILGFSLVTLSILLFHFYAEVPISYYRAYAPGSPSPVPAAQTQNDVPQPGFFKDQPEWDWDVPEYSNGWKGYARTPRPRDVVLLTASDGGGHNSAIPNVLERVLEDREAYCEKHGYTSLWLNTSRYDIGDAHRTWSKVPAVAEAFSLYPTAEWIFLLDTDIILMTPGYDIIESILSPSAISSGLLLNTPILDGKLKKNPTHIRTPTSYRVQDVDILITQDHQFVNTGAMFFRRSAFTRYLLEIMTDYSMLMGHEHNGAEQDSLKHLLLEHELVRKHVGIYPQRKFNAYAQGGDAMGWRDGDLLVHLAGCWVKKKCAVMFEEFWGKRGFEGVWKVDKSHGDGVKGGLVKDEGAN